MKTVRIIAILCAVSLIGASHLGCFSGVAGEQYENVAPDVWLSSGPPEASVNTYFVHLYWGGFDPDGEIAGYQYVITNNPPDGIFVNKELYDAFENPDVGTFEDPNNRTSVWEGKFLTDKAGRRILNQYGKPIIVEQRKVWNGITMYGRNIRPNDSTFVFSADIQQDPSSKEWIEEFRRTHTFFIRAVDDKGGVTPWQKIAYRSFTARTLSPTIDVQIPTRTYPGNPALVPPIIMFKWAARDFIDNLVRVQNPDSVRWVLWPQLDAGFDATVAYIKSLTYDKWTSKSRRWPSGWIPYNAPGDSGKFAVSYTMNIGGNYVFAVQAKDEAGAVTPVFDEAHNVRRLLAARRTAGPVLVVFNRFVGTVTGATISTPIVIFDLPEGVPLSFCFHANAEQYGGIVSGYRYGWDILNLNNDADWETDITPFIASEACSPERTYYFGTHTFYVEVIDNSGFKSRVGIRMNIVPFSMDRDLLIVDDYENGTGNLQSTNGYTPSDAELDAFWINMVSNVARFDPVQDMIQVKSTSLLPITVLARYKGIIWDVYGNHAFPSIANPTLLYRLIKFVAPRESSQGGKVEPNLLALYLAAGGHVLLCGAQPLSCSINGGYFNNALVFPNILLYESGGTQSGDYRDGPIGRTSFTYNEACLDVLDYAFTDQAYRRAFCRVSKRYPSVDGMRTINRVDEREYNVGDKSYSFPVSATFIPAVTKFGFAYSVNGYNTELYNPEYFVSCDTSLVTYDRRPRGCFEPIFRQTTASPSSIVNNCIIGYWTSARADAIPKQGVPARSAIFGFEPFFFNNNRMRRAIETVVLGEWQLESVQ